MRQFPAAADAAAEVGGRVTRTVRPSRRILSLLSLAAVAVATSWAGAPGGATAAKPAASAPAPAGNFSCRASLVRTEGFAVGLLNQEPVVANAQNNPCVGEDAALIDPLNPLTIGSVATVRALYTQTNNGTREADAQAGAADAVITIPGAPTIRASALTSRAAATCGTGTAAPTLSGSSNVLFLQIGDGDPIINVSEPQTIPLPGGGNVFLNQQTVANNEVTQRALRVEVPGVGTVTIAESRADFHGNPCATKDTNGGGGGGDVPQCSDERDNDGDGKIDFPNDPGCDSPQDDNETDGSDEPDCSDGEDNDGDGYTDYPRDPGCESREDPDETDNDEPECSDGADNDGDRRVDFPADNGCKSASDDDEAAGFMTGGGGYDEVDKKTLPEDYVDPGSSLRFGEVFPCDLGDSPGPNLNVTWHDPRLVQQVKLDSQTRAFCRNDPFISPGRPAAEFDTYVGEGSGTMRNAATGLRVPVQIDWVSIDRGEPGSPPVIGVDYFEIRVRSAGLTVAQGIGTLDHGNIQAHTPGSFRQKKTPN